MPSKSKSKGNSFELEIAKLLSKTYDDSFLRVPNSGAMIGRSNSSRKESMSKNQIKFFRGDIQSPDDCEICIECKNYASFPFHSFLQINEEIKQLQGWINEVEFDAPDMFWLLIFKITRKGTYVCWNRKKYPKLFGHPVTYKNYGICEINDFLANNKNNLLNYMKK